MKFAVPRGRIDEEEIKKSLEHIKQSNRRVYSYLFFEARELVSDKERLGMHDVDIVGGFVKNYVSPLPYMGNETLFTKAVLRINELEIFLRFVNYKNLQKFTEDTEKLIEAFKKLDEAVAEKLREMGLIDKDLPNSKIAEFEPALPERILIDKILQEYANYWIGEVEEIIRKENENENHSG